VILQLVWCEPVFFSTHLQVVPPPPPTPNLDWLFPVQLGRLPIGGRHVPRVPHMRRPPFMTARVCVFVAPFLVLTGAVFGRADSLHGRRKHLFFFHVGSPILSETTLFAHSPLLLRPRPPFAEVSAFFSHSTRLCPFAAPLSRAGSLGVSSKQFRSKAVGSRPWSTFCSFTACMDFCVCTSFCFSLSLLSETFCASVTCS